MAEIKSCERCSNEFTARDQKNRFCSAECRVQWWSHKKTESVDRTCEVCNSNFLGAKKTKYCSVLCREVALSTKKQIFTDEDIVYVILLNPGCGMSRLRKEFAKLLKLKKQKGGPTKTRILGVCDYYKSEKGLDLYAILQDPDYLQKVKVTEYLSITGNKYLPPGQGINSGNRTALKKYRDGSMKEVTGQRHVRVDLRKFNWGRLAQSED